VCGLHLGRALWAKQAAGPTVISVALLFVLSRLGLVRWKWLSPGRLAGVLVVAALLAGPWYARNVLLGRPFESINAADASRVDRSLPSLLAPVRWWDELGCPGSPFLFLGLASLVIGALAPADARVPARSAAFAVGALLCSGVLITNTLGRHVPPLDMYALGFGTMLIASSLAVSGWVGLRSPHAILLVWIAPLLLVWWVKCSFTARYLLPILPVLAATGARVALRALGSAFRRNPAAWVLVLALAALLTSETYPLWRTTLRLVVDHPLASREEKWELYPGPAYRIARFLLARQDARSARIGTNDTRMSYFLGPGVTFHGLPESADDLAGLDWVVIAPFGPSTASRPEEVRHAHDATRRVLSRVPLLLADGGYEVYRLR
jgi:hypothetical protein